MASSIGTRSAAIRPSSDQATHSPPSRHGATLSGWPSRSAASCNTLASGNAATPPATSPRASRTPATMAAEDDPRPRPCGIRLTHCSAMPAGWPPSRSKAARMARITRCDSSVGTVCAPSPATSIRTRRSPMARATTSSCRSRASPNASKPGPRLALVAGTRTSTWPVPISTIMGGYRSRRRGPAKSRSDPGPLRWFCGVEGRNRTAVVGGRGLARSCQSELDGRGVPVDRDGDRLGCP